MLRNLGNLGNNGSNGNNGNDGSNGKNERSHLNLLCNSFVFGFRGYSRREYDEKERYVAAKFI